MILDGKQIAHEMYESLWSQISSLVKKPTLWAVLVWDSNSPSLRYIKQKKRETKKIGMWFSLTHLPKDISEDELIQEIQKLNTNKDISGYIVQLPLPSDIDPLHVIRNIDPQKDVDGFHPENQGKVMIGDPSGFSPCTPAGVMQIFSYYDIWLKWKNIVVLGQSNIVGKPMAQMCINSGATVVSCNHLTPDISVYTRQADIIISATGQIGLITPDIVKEDAVIIDVWFSIRDGEIFGDTEYEPLLSAWHDITPVPGWVGPMTVAMLLSNTLRAHKQAHEKTI